MCQRCTEHKGKRRCEKGGEAHNASPARQRTQRGDGGVGPQGAAGKAVPQPRVHRGPSPHPQHRDPCRPQAQQDVVHRAARTDSPRHDVTPCGQRGIRSRVASTRTGRRQRLSVCSGKRLECLCLALAAEAPVLTCNGRACHTLSHEAALCAAFVVGRQFRACATERFTRKAASGVRSRSHAWLRSGEGGHGGRVAAPPVGVRGEQDGAAGCQQRAHCSYDDGSLAGTRHAEHQRIVPRRQYPAPSPAPLAASIWWTLSSSFRRAMPRPWTAADLLVGEIQGHSIGSDHSSCMEGMQAVGCTRGRQ